LYVLIERRKISRSVLYDVEYGSCTQYVYTYMNSQFLQAANDWLFISLDCDSFLHCRDAKFAFSKFEVRL